MKFLIAYYSETGNTKKVAEAIYEAIPHEKDLSNISQLKDLKGYDLIFFGFPVHASKMPKKPAQFLKGHSKGKKIALFCTQGARKDSEFAEKILQNAKKQSPAAEVIALSIAEVKLLKRYWHPHRKTLNTNLGPRAPRRQQDIQIKKI